MIEPDNGLSHFPHVPDTVILGGADLLWQVLQTGLPFLTPKPPAIFSEHSQQTKHSGCHFFSNAVKILCPKGLLHPPQTINKIKFLKKKS